MKLFKLKKVLAGFLAFVMVAGYTSTVSAATSTDRNSSSSSSSTFDDAPVWAYDIFTRFSIYYSTFSSSPTSVNDIAFI